MNEKFSGSILQFSVSHDASEIVQIWCLKYISIINYLKLSLFLWKPGYFIS